jgi:hypothetical protein
MEGCEMTDRELLELAAKAADMDWCAYWPDKVDDCSLCLQPRGRLWNPLTDDGDALRLAVKLGCATLNFYSQACFVSRYEGEEVICEKLGRDPYAATRRAIVRAAAEIGRGMP